MGRAEEVDRLGGNVADVDAQRARWERYRASQRMTKDAGDQFACGGLGDHCDDLGARLLFLPSDPEAARVPLSQEVMGWLKEERPPACGGRSSRWGQMQRAATDALVLYNQYRDDAGWARYLALHRHGGIEVGLGRLAHEIREIRVFPLRTIVWFAWNAAALQVEAIERWQITPPLEIVLGLRNTRRATLGEFAEGWSNPGYGLPECSLCLDDNVLLRYEVSDGFDPETFAIELGDRIEHAFGTTHRRHLANRGEYEGRFDPRIW